MPVPPPGTSGEVPATDTREFLKTNFNAEIRTRDVQELTRRAETTVRGFDGRVDQTSSSEKHGYIRFVVPASRFDEFRAEVESFVDPRYIRIDIGTENLLSEKRSIEEQQATADSYLSQLQSERSALTASHDRALKDLQATSAAYSAQLAQIRATTPADDEERAQLQIEEQGMLAKIASVNAQIASEQKAYTAQSASLDSSIASAQTAVKAVKTQDQALLDSVATVEGSISFEWISYWEIAQLYLPGYWIPGIIALIAVLAYYFERRKPFFAVQP
jgi:hypothetical protein